MRAAVVLGALGAALVAGSAAAQVRWYKSALNPVMVHADSFPEGAAIGQPAVLAVGGELRMWYTGGGLDIRGRILAARSADGGLTWHRDNGGEPVLDTGPDGGWDSLTIDTPEVVADGVQALLLRIELERRHRGVDRSCDVQRRPDVHSLGYGPGARAGAAGQLGRAVG